MPLNEVFVSRLLIANVCWLGWISKLLRLVIKFLPVSFRTFSRFKTRGIHSDYLIVSGIHKFEILVRCFRTWIVYETTSSLRFAAVAKRASVLAILNLDTFTTARVRTAYWKLILSFEGSWRSCIVIAVLVKSLVAIFKRWSLLFVAWNYVYLKTCHVWWLLSKMGRRVVIFLAVLVTEIWNNLGHTLTFVYIFLGKRLKFVFLELVATIELVLALSHHRRWEILSLNCNCKHWGARFEYWRWQWKKLFISYRHSRVERARICVHYWTLLLKVDWSPLAAATNEIVEFLFFSINLVVCDLQNLLIVVNNRFLCLVWRLAWSIIKFNLEITNFRRAEVNLIFQIDLLFHWLSFFHIHIYLFLDYELRFMIL